MCGEWDFAHGCQLDVLGSSRDVGKFPFALCLMVVANFFHSPDKDPHMRRQQSTESRRWFFENMAEGTCEFFQTHLTQLAKECAGHMEPAGSEPTTLSSRVWRHLKSKAERGVPLEEKSIVADS